MSERTNWQLDNRRYLIAALDVVRAALSGDSERGARTAQSAAAVAALERELKLPAALQLLVETFGLTPFERDILVMSAGQDLDPEFAQLCPSPSLGLALAKLRGAHWRALTPQAPLRRWQLIVLGEGPVLTARPLRIAESVLHYLVGAPALDTHLRHLVHPVVASPLAASGQARAAERGASLLDAAERGEAPIVQLTGADATARREVATAACERIDHLLHVLDAGDIPADPRERATLATRWDRDARLLGSALLIEGDDLQGPERLSGIEGLLRHLQGKVLLSAPAPLPLSCPRTVITVTVQPLSAQEQADLWYESLYRAALASGRRELLAGLDGTTQALINQFSLGAPAIRAASAEAISRLAQNGREPQAQETAKTDSGKTDLEREIWEACRTQARPRLEDLAQRIEPAARWNDLVLPPSEKNILAQIKAQVRQRYRVNETWGFAAKSRRGLGVSALFCGGSGTGKTMAAEVIAAGLEVDLYRIDLSAVVSKYIGETEKNLRRIFDAAETGGAILLFDEADALFGKRGEVHDSHDRYANIEVSYLLQRMEAYRGLAILTTNRKQDLDQAFLRRIRFVVTFQFPSARERAEIWQGIFPDRTPTEGLEPAKLAQLTITGGNIRSIAMGAAYLAADEGCPVRMRHILSATRTEYAKLDKPLSDAEIRGWL